MGSEVALDHGARGVPGLSAVRGVLRTSAKEPSWAEGSSIRAKKEVLVRQGLDTHQPVVMVINGGEFVKLIEGEVQATSGMEWVNVGGVDGTGWIPKHDSDLISKETTSPCPTSQDLPGTRGFTFGPGGAALRR